MTYIKGNKNLARAIGVSERTVQNWRKEDVLVPAIVSEYGRIIIYHLERVYECLNYRKIHSIRKGKSLTKK